MLNKYTHLNLNEDVRAIAGCYIPQKEVNLKVDGREVLYVIGEAIIESSCCSTGNWTYAIVPGYILSWQKETNADGLPVSEVTPITEAAVRKEVSRIIKEKESVSQVDFW